MSKQNIEERVESRVCFKLAGRLGAGKDPRLGSGTAGGGSHGVIRASVNETVWSPPLKFSLAGPGR